MTPEQWQEVEKRFRVPWGYAQLRVDGYDLRVEVRAIGPLRYVLVPFVNGWTRGAWLVRNDAGEWCEEARRFLPLKRHRLWTAAQVRRVGKRLAKKMGLLNGHYEVRAGHWTSFGALKRHLIANNESIELTPETKL